MGTTIVGPRYIVSQTDSHTYQIVDTQGVPREVAVVADYGIIGATAYGDTRDATGIRKTAVRMDYAMRGV